MGCATQKAVPTWRDTQGPDGPVTQGCSAWRPSLWEGGPLQGGRRPLEQCCRKRPWSPELPDMGEGPLAPGSPAQGAKAPE